MCMISSLMYRVVTSSVEERETLDEEEENSNRQQLEELVSEYFSGPDAQFRTLDSGFYRHPQFSLWLKSQRQKVRLLS